MTGSTALFGDVHYITSSSPRIEKLETALDALKSKYGENIVQKGAFQNYK